MEFILSTPNVNWIVKRVRIADNDVGQGCYGAMKVRDAFANAFRELRDAALPQYEHVQALGSSILGRILLIPHEIVEYRSLIQQRHIRRPYCSFTAMEEFIEPAPMISVVTQQLQDDM